MSYVIALDLGTKTGVAKSLIEHDLIWASGVKDFSIKGKFEDKSFLDFYYWLRESVSAMACFTPVTIVVEKPNSRMPSWAGLRVHFGIFGIVQMIKASFPNVTLETVPALTIKKFWTGTGRADKEFMVEHTQRLYPEVTDDNESDAIAIWHWYQTEMEGLDADK